MGIRHAATDDLRDVARIHKCRFGGPEYTLGQFSLSLIRGFYAPFLDRGVFLVHLSEGRIDGFVVGGTHQHVNSAQRAFVARNMLRCCWEAVCHPSLWPAAHQFLRRSFLPQPAKLMILLAPNLPKMLSLAVVETAEGRGAALALVQAFEACICQRYAGYTLSVLKVNERAVRFYEKLGMQLVVDAFPRSFVFRKYFHESPRCRI